MERVFFFFFPFLLGAGVRVFFGGGRQVRYLGR